MLRASRTQLAAIFLLPVLCLAGCSSAAFQSTQVLRITSATRQVLVSGCTTKLAVDRGGNMSTLGDLALVPGARGGTLTSAVLQRFFVPFNGRRHDAILVMYTASSDAPNSVRSYIRLLRLGKAARGAEELQLSAPVTLPPPMLGSGAQWTLAAAAVSPNEKTVFAVMLSLLDNVQVLAEYQLHDNSSAVSLIHVARLPIGYFAHTGFVPAVNVIEDPQALIVSRDGHTVYVAGIARHHAHGRLIDVKNEVLRFDISTQRMLAPIVVFSGASASLPGAEGGDALELLPDGDLVDVLGAGAGAVSGQAYMPRVVLLDPSRRAIVRVVDLQTQPSATLVSAVTMLQTQDSVDISEEPGGVVVVGDLFGISAVNMVSGTLEWHSLPFGSSWGGRVAGMVEVYRDAGGLASEDRPLGLTHRSFRMPLGAPVVAVGAGSPGSAFVPMMRLVVPADIAPRDVTVGDAQTMQTTSGGIVRVGLRSGLVSGESVDPYGCRIGLGLVPEAVAILSYHHSGVSRG